MNVYGLHKKTDQQCAQNKQKKKKAKVIRSNSAQVKIQFKIKFKPFSKKKIKFLIFLNVVIPTKDLSIHVSFTTVGLILMKLG